MLAKEPDDQYQIPSEGVHQAICIWVYDLGTQYSEKWDKYSHRALITWELPDELITTQDENNVPMIISKEYTLSLHMKSQLRKDLSAWRGKTFTNEELKNGFDLTKLLGVNCQLQIIHNTTENRTYANIASIMSMPKGAKILKPHHPLIKYDIGAEIPEGTPEWIENKIRTAQEMDNQQGKVPEEITDLEPF